MSQLDREGSCEQAGQRQSQSDVLSMTFKEHGRIPPHGGERRHGGSNLPEQVSGHQTALGRKYTWAPRIPSSKELFLLLTSEGGFRQYVSGNPWSSLLHHSLWLQTHPSEVGGSIPPLVRKGKEGGRV